MIFNSKLSAYLVKTVFVCCFKAAEFRPEQWTLLLVFCSELWPVYPRTCSWTSPRLKRRVQAEDSSERGHRTNRYTASRLRSYLRSAPGSPLAPPPPPGCGSPRPCCSLCPLRTRLHPAACSVTPRRGELPVDTSRRGSTEPRGERRTHSGGSDRDVALRAREECPGCSGWTRTRTWRLCGSRTWRLRCCCCADMIRTDRGVTPRGKTEPTVRSLRRSGTKNKQNKNKLSFYGRGWGPLV